MINFSGSSRTWLLVVMSIILIVTLVALAQIDTRVIFGEIRQLSAFSVSAAAAVLIVGVLLSTVRLWYISADIGTPLTFKEALLALSVGQIVGAVSVQFFGQIVARGALLRGRGLSAPANIVMASYERFVAVGVSGLMAIIGAWYLFGRLALDLEGGGAQFLKVVAGILGAVTIGAVTAWGGPVFRALAQATNAKTAIAIGRNLILTIAVQLSFALLLAICALPLLPRPLRGMALAVVIVGLWFAGSRAALGTFAILVGLIRYLKVLSIRQICLAILAFVAVLVVVSAIPLVSGITLNSYLGNGVPIFIDNTILGSSNLQRLKSMTDGMNLFFSHPVFGAGLGVYMNEQIKSGTALVIHSTPIWLLAEGGVVGLAAFAIPGALIFMNAWRERKNDASAQTVILTLVTFAVMASVHELLYQRMLWLVLGVSLSRIATASGKDQTGAP